MQVVNSYEDFYARRQGDGALVIGGTVVFSTGGWTADLRARENHGNTGFNPLIFFAELVFAGPPEGTAVTEVLTPVALDPLRIEAPALEYREVEFSVIGSDDVPPERLTVEDASS